MVFKYQSSFSGNQPLQHSITTGQSLDKLKCVFLKNN